MNNKLHRPLLRTQRLRSIALALLALQGSAHAVDHVWKGAHGDWEDANQWTLLGVPDASDSVLLTAGSAALSSTRNVGALRLNGGWLYGGDLTATELSFEAGILGGFTGIYPTGATTITGTSTFNGTRNQAISLNHTLTLQGDGRWTAGNGTLGGSVHGGVVVNNATFTDDGAGNATDYKTLRGSSGGSFVNNGSYVRNGLGLTRAHGFENQGLVQVNSGTLQLRDGGSSSGQINVAAGAQLSFYWSTAVVSGSIANLGVVSFDRSNVTLTSTAQLNGNVQVLDGWVYSNNTSTLNTLSMQQGALLAGTGHWTVGTLDFQAGTLGGAPNYFPTGATTVTGTSLFNGTRTQGVSLNHTLTLQGNSRWTAGDGAISGSVFGGVIVNNAVFADEGAGSAAAYKTLRGGGGTFVNEGSYVRSGAGTTRAYGFDNRGELSIQSGTFDAREGFSNTGATEIAAGAVLRTTAANAGLITGAGTVSTGGSHLAWVNNGTLAPGHDAALGTLTVEGSLQLGDSSVLHVDLDSAGMSDLLAVTQQAFWNGELSVWLAQGATLQLGDVYTIASSGQRLSTSTFDSITWHGLGSNQLAVEYTANSVLLRVTAVPEPATYALWAFGLAFVAGRTMRRKPARASS